MNQQAIKTLENLGFTRKTPTGIWETGSIAVAYDQYNKMWNTYIKNYDGKYNVLNISTYLNADATNLHNWLTNIKSKLLKETEWHIKTLESLSK